MVFSSFPDAGDVRFSLGGATYQNNSVVALKNIDEGDNVLLCISNQTDSCQHPPTGIVDPGFGSWFFPNGTKVPSVSNQWGFYSSRDPGVVGMSRRRGGVTGVFRCEIPVATNVTQTIYIGVYTADAGEWYM